MPRLTINSILPDFTFETPDESNLSLSRIATRVSGKTALVFLRYYGCTLCQYDLHQYARNYSENTKGGGQLLVVLQFSPSSIKEQMGQERFPFELIWITIENSVVRHISGCGFISGWQVCFRTRFASAEGPDGTPANPLA